jgi:mRNA-degrading endonuclease RelE of RelBE toxin-antitoxin system
MEFRIADSFTDSLVRLSGDEQKAVKTTAFDLQLNPANPGMQFHRLNKAKDKNFWSVRVSEDLRLIVHRSNDSLLLCYVDHHDKAYDWAERRKLEQHPVTGAAQMVEIRETVKEVVVPVYVQRERANETDRLESLSRRARKPVDNKPLFAASSDEELLGYGVPAEWLSDVKNVTSDDMLLSLADHLPSEAAEALFELATGGMPSAIRISSHGLVASDKSVIEPSAFSHPDAQRRFRVMGNVAELQRALDFPWEKWTVFLHPEQRQWVERDYNGPARMSGSAGTGKTIVALHRAAHLARKHPGARVLLTTFSDALANSLRSKLNRLIGNEPRLAEQIDVYSLDVIGLRLYEARIGGAVLASRDAIREFVKQAAAAVGGHKFGLHFLLTE